MPRRRAPPQHLAGVDDRHEHHAAQLPCECAHISKTRASRSPYVHGRALTELPDLGRRVSSTSPFRPPTGSPNVQFGRRRGGCRRAAQVTVGMSWMSRLSRGTVLVPAQSTGAAHALDGDARCGTLAPIVQALRMAFAFAACVQDACKRFNTGCRLTDSATREDGGDLQEHHEPPSGPTGHHGPGSPLNLRVRGSSPWRRTMPDLALCSFQAASRRHVVGPKRANACKKRARLARIAQRA